MKKTIVCLIFALPVAALIAQSMFQFGQFAKVNSSTSTPTQLTNTTIKARSVTLFGFKAMQSSNTSTVYIGFSLTDGAQGIPVIPGGSATLKSADGQRSLSLSNIWFDVVTANDGLLIYYE